MSTTQTKNDPGAVQIERLVGRRVDTVMLFGEIDSLDELGASLRAAMPTIQKGAARVAITRISPEQRDMFRGIWGTDLSGHLETPRGKIEFQVNPSEEILADPKRPEDGTVPGSYDLLATVLCALKTPKM